MAIRMSETRRSARAREDRPRGMEPIRDRVALLDDRDDGSFRPKAPPWTD